MRILNTDIEQNIAASIIQNCLSRKYDSAIENISKIIDELYANIPDNQRISFGRVHTIKVLSEYLFDQLGQIKASTFEIAAILFKKGNDFKTRGVALGILSRIGLNDYDQVIPFFESAAMDKNWDVREMSQMFFKMLIKKFPDEMKDYLLQLTKSEHPNVRRFVAETLRPVQENRWFYQHPDYPLSILKNLFKEPVAYPRTAVGNNLSDLARRLPDLVYELVKQLVASGNPNSFWIAYRACRNLVKQEPIKVMDLLKVDEYKYKDRIYRRSDHQRN
ncbi:MAG: DNA alkylation repair protein [bacterium]|nr:DNA alkylation repair protein [bacterium]